MTVQDGAFAWLLCVACFLNITLIGGIISTSGIFYIMFKDSLDATDSEVSLITSINIGVMHFVCPFAGLLSGRYGVRCVSMIGASLSTAGLVGGAFSIQIYQMYLTYGLIAGTGLGMVFNSSITVIDPYFKKYKRAACSLVFTGFGVGSFILPPILNSLEDVYGWRGAILLLAGINAHLLLTCALFRPFNNNPCQVNNSHIKQHVEFNNGHFGGPTKQRSLKYDIIRILLLFKIITFSCLCVFTFLYIFSQSILITHFGSYVMTLGFSSRDVVKLYMVFGISSTLARPITGIIAQVTNANAASFIVLTLLLNGLVTLCVPFMTQLWMLYVYAVFVQIFITPSNLLGVVIVMENVPKSQVAVAYGITMVVCVPGYTLAGPVAVWLYDYTHVYSHSFFLVGGLLILAALAMVLASYHIHKTRHEDIPASNTVHKNEL